MTLQIECDVDGGVDALPIIVALDICEEVALGLLAGCPAPLMDEFDLQRVKKLSMGAPPHLLFRPSDSDHATEKTLLSLTTSRDDLTLAIR